MNITIRRVVGLGVGALAFVSVYTFAVQTHAGQTLENDALQAATYTNGSPFLLSLVSTRSLIAATLVIVAVALVQRRLDSALRAFIVLALCNGATQVLKRYVLERPNFGGQLLHNTFPSGHTTAYLSVALAVVIILPARWRSIGSIVGAAVCMMVTIDLLGYGWHRLSDILGSLALALAVVSAALIAVRSRKNEPAQPFLHAAISRVYFFLATGGISLAIVLTVLSQITTERPALFLLISSQFVAITGIVGLFWGVNRLFDPATESISRRQPATMTS